MAKEFHFSDIVGKVTKGISQSHRKTHLEINLVPDIKAEMIKTLKLRNLIFFLCIVVASASAGAVFLFGVTAGIQQNAIDGKKNTISNLSAKLKSYSDLDDFLTIKDQLGNISDLTSNKKVLSRTFNILSALLPTGSDTITISELSVSLADGQPTFTFDAQANAGSEPYIDYNVLDSFKKSMQYMSYDYGKYVDREGNDIPAYCMIESGTDGATFTDQDRGIYAFWTINGDGCNPSKTATPNSYNLEKYENEDVVRIWRTPQYSDWYKETEVASQPYMSLSGEIKNVPHFKSACITYTGDISQSSVSPKWIETNEACRLVPDGTDGITISDSSNGRDSNSELVLRFSATILIAPEAYQFSNTHMLAFAPSGRRNVTDSYVQVQAMFGERAADCTEGDAGCNSAPAIPNPNGPDNDTPNSNTPNSNSNGRN